MADARTLEATNQVENHIRWAAILICLGLVVLSITLLGVHPLAVVAFAVIGCPLVLAGILLFLYSIVAHQPKAEK
jgi:hypothetical protein